MRVPLVAVGAVALITALTLTASNDLTAQSAGGDATATLTAARQALGGEQRLSSVKTLVATGRTRQVRGDNLVPIEFEINIELPDKYVRHDEIPAQETGITSRGFNGETLIQIPPPAGPPPGTRPQAPPGLLAPPGSPAPVVPLKQDFARLTLGMFATSLPVYPLTFTYVGVAEAPEGKADVVEARGTAGFTARLFIDSKTHLPVMLSWMGPPAARPMPGQPPPAPVENRLYYADYRGVDGLQFPFRIRRATGATTIEEMTFDRYRVNAKIDPKKFEVKK